MKIKKSITITITFIICSVSFYYLTAKPKVTEAEYDKHVDKCLTEMPYFMKGKELNDYINRCILDKTGKLKIQRTGWGKRTYLKDSRGRPMIKRWDKEKPRRFDIYRMSMGSNFNTCEDKCSGIANDPSCIPQCIESIEKSICAYKYDVVIVENCKPGAFWDKQDSWIWSMPKAVIDDRKMPLLYQCLAPYARLMDNCSTCASLKRCEAVCRNDYTSQEGSRNLDECTAKCRYWFKKVVGKCGQKFFK